MISIPIFRELALSFPGAIEHPHFDRVAFKVSNKRIFATLHEASEIANLKFSPEDQAAYCSFDPKAVSPVPNKWGLQGWTSFDLKSVSRELMWDALNTAYAAVITTRKKK